MGVVRAVWGTALAAWIAMLTGLAAEVAIAEDGDRSPVYLGAVYNGAAADQKHRGTIQSSSAYVEAEVPLFASDSQEIGVAFLLERSQFAVSHGENLLSRAGRELIKPSRQGNLFSGGTEAEFMFSDRYKWGHLSVIPSAGGIVGVGDGAALAGAFMPQVSITTTYTHSADLTYGIGIYDYGQLEQEALIVPVPYVRWRKNRWTLSIGEDDITAHLKYALGNGFEIGLRAGYEFHQFQMPKGVGGERLAFRQDADVLALSLTHAGSAWGTITLEGGLLMPQDYTIRNYQRGLVSGWTTDTTGFVSLMLRPHWDW